MSEINRNDQIRKPPITAEENPQLPTGPDGHNPRGESLGRQLRKNRPPRMYRTSTLMTSPNPPIRNVKSS